MRLFLSRLRLTRVLHVGCRCSFMPRDKGGIGRMGGKHKKKAPKKPRKAGEGAPKRAVKAPAAAKAAAPALKKRQQPPPPPAAEPVTDTIRPPRRSRIRKVRFVVDRPQKVRRYPYRWTWGGKWQRATIRRRQFEPDEPSWVQLDAFRAHLWGLRVADHVARGCVGDGWTRSYDRDTAWAKTASHRSWCPDHLPDPMLRDGRWRCDAAEYPWAREMYYGGTSVFRHPDAN